MSEALASQCFRKMGTVSASREPAVPLALPACFRGCDNGKGAKMQIADISNLRRTGRSQYLQNKEGPKKDLVDQAKCMWTFQALPNCLVLNPISWSEHLCHQGLERLPMLSMLSEPFRLPSSALVCFRAFLCSLMESHLV